MLAQLPKRAHVINNWSRRVRLFMPCESCRTSFTKVSEGGLGWGGQNHSESDGRESLLFSLQWQ